MKKLRLKKVTILSLKEKKGKIIEFDKQFNIILGDNDTGKSSLLKSIFYAFGAETYMHPTWKLINPIVIVDFEYNTQDYIILRNKSEIIVYDKNLNILNHSQSITKEFSIFFSKFFNFKIDLTNRKNKKSQATPAFCLLPFYIDQDLSWTKNWNSFEHLGQFKSWKSDVISFHTGTRPSEYYKLKSEKDILSEQKKELETEKKILQSIYDKALEKFKNVDLNISLDEFKKEIIRLLEQLNELKEFIEVSKQKLRDNYNQKFLLEEQIKITEISLKEINKDYEFCIKGVENDVECPTCGAFYENSFAERFSIAKDENECLDLLQELNKDLKEIINKINKNKEELFAKNTKTENIENILQTKKEQITLMKLIDYKGNKNFISILDEQLEQLNTKLGKIILKIQDIVKKLKEIDSREKMKEITQEYRNNMKLYLDLLDVQNLSYEDYKSLYSSIKESGSDKPRALLAYYFSILELILKDSNSSTIFPIIIDAPKQQEQDEKNEKRILEFIRDKCPKGAQLLLGVVELCGVNFEANIINLKDKLSLLDLNEFKKSFEYYKELIKRCYKK